MKNLIHIGFGISLLFLVGCSPARLVPPPQVSADSQSEVIVYRENAFNAALVPVIFGENGFDYLKLSNDEYARIYLNSGNTNLFVRSDQGDNPYVLNTELTAGEKKCFKAYANPSNYAKAMFFNLAYYFGNTFLLEEMSCPSDKGIEKYIRTYNSGVKS